MTVPAAVTAYRYQGNGVTTIFAYSNRLLTTSDVKVQIITRATGVIAETLTLTTDYSVTLVSNSLANITITNATKIPSSLQDILLSLDIGITQTRSFPRADSLPAADIERGLDKLTLIAQLLTDGQTRSLRFPVSDTTSSGLLPTKIDRASKFLAFDSNGDPTTIASGSALLAAGIVSVGQYTTGNTVDDTAAFQSAINDAVTSGKALFVPPATYTVTNLSVTGSLLMYAGGEGAIIKQKDSTSGDIITFTGNAKQFIVRDIVFDGNQANQSAQSTNCIIQSTADGASSSDAAITMVDNCEFRNAAWASISIYGDNTNATREILYVNNCRFRDGAEGVDNGGTDYIPRDISLGDSVEVFITNCDSDSSSAPTIGRCALVVGQTQTASVRYTEGFVSNWSIRRRGCNVSQGLAAVDLYIWAKNFHVNKLNIKDSAWIALKWKSNISAVSFTDIVIDGVPTNISAVAGNQATTSDSNDALSIDGLIVRNSDYAANYTIVIEGKSSSDYSSGYTIRNVTVDNITGAAMLISNCKNVQVSGVNVNGGTIALSFQSCDGLGKISDCLFTAQTNASLYIDNNEATFDYTVEDVAIVGNLRAGYAAFVEGRHGVISNLLIDGCTNGLNFNTHTSLHLNGVRIPVASGTLGIVGADTVTDITVHNCYVAAGVTTQFSGGTYTNLHGGGNNFAMPANAQFRAGTMTLSTALSAANGGTGLTSLGTGVATFLGTPSSANLASAVTDETGSGLLVFATSPTITTPRIVGVTSGVDATAGDVGEFLSVTVLSGAAVSLTTTVTANITSLSLGAGDFDVTGNCVWQGTGTTSWTQIDAQINASSAAFATFPASGAAMRHTTAALVASGPFAHTLGQRRFNSSGAQTAYLNASASFTVSTASAFGFLGARRRR